jgi:hypothetical protein
MNHDTFMRTAEVDGKEAWPDRLGGVERELPLEREASCCEIWARRIMTVSIKLGCTCF